MTMVLTDDEIRWVKRRNKELVIGDIAKAMNERYAGYVWARFNIDIDARIRADFDGFIKQDVHFDPTRPEPYFVD